MRTMVLTPSGNNAVAVAGSTSGLEINLAGSLFRERGSENGDENIHCW